MEVNEGIKSNGVLGGVFGMEFGLKRVISERFSQWQSFERCR